MYALNFYSDLYGDILRNYRKTATIRLGDKRDKYKTGMLVWITIGPRFGRRQKLYTAILDRVEYKKISELSPRDIERENPLFLPQSKIFQGSFGFGPVIATPASIPDPHALTIRCVIERAGRTLFEGRASTGDLKRRVEELVDWLQRYNPVPAGSVLSTGTGILVPDEHALAPGDVVTITIDGIGTLRNPVRRLG